MSIPASAIVQVNPRLIDAGGSGLELNGLYLTTNADIPVNSRVLQFTSPDDNQAYFGAGSAEDIAGQTYFPGYDNSFKKPRTMFVARWVNEAAAPYLRGAEVSATVGDFRQVTGGSLSMTLDGYTAMLEDLDFSGVTSWSEAAQVLEAGIRAQAGGGSAWTMATVSYTSRFKAFCITGGATGAGNVVSFATGDVAEMMMLTEAAGAVVSDGADAETLTECMEAVRKVTENWVPFTVVFDTTDEQDTELAAWSNAKGVRFLYVIWSRAASLLVPFGENNIGTTLQNMSVSAVTGVYGDLDLASFVCGMIASIDYTQTQGAITTAFKSQDGQSYTVGDEPTANSLEQKGFNWYGDYATANDRFVFFYPGQMFGRYLFIDTYVNAVWLNNALQLAILSLFKNVSRIPYTETGYALVRAAMMDPITQAKNAGVIDAGVTLSQAQRAQVNREAGVNIVSSLEQDGFYIQIKDPTAQVRAQRQTPVVNFWYSSGGSVHKLEMASTVII